MSVDLASLAIEIDARDPERAVGTLERLTRAGAAAEGQTDRLAASHRALAAEARSAGGAHRLLAGAVAGVGLAAAASQVAALADGYTGFANQLKVAGLEGRNLQGVQDALFVTAQKYGQQLEGLGTLYGRSSLAAKELGATQSELLAFTNTTAAALKVQGGNAASSSGALLQLSQALGGGIVRAEEFNSILEGARPLLQAAADGNAKYAGSITKLRNEVLAGKVTSNEFFDSILAGSAQLEQKAAKANLTIAASFTVLNNALGQYIGQADQQYSVTQRISQGIVDFSEHLDDVVPVLATVIGYVGVRYAAAGAQFVATEAARVTAIGATLNAERASAISTAQLAVSRTASQAASLAATQASLALEQRAAAARIASANATIAANQGTLAGTAAVTLAERARAAALAQLIALGGQANAITAQSAVVSQAAAVAQTELAAATRMTTASMAGMRAAGGGLVALMGGPWGIAFTAAAVVVYSLVKAVDATRTTTENAKIATKQYSEAMGEASGFLKTAAESSAKFGANNAGAVSGTNALAGATIDLANKTFTLASARAEAARQALNEARASNTKEINRLENPGLLTRAGRAIMGARMGPMGVDLNARDLEQAKKLRAQNADLLAAEMKVMFDPRSAKADPITNVTNALGKQGKAAKDAKADIDEWAKSLAEGQAAAERFASDLETENLRLTPRQTQQRSIDLAELEAVASGADDAAARIRAAGAAWSDFQDLLDGATEREQRFGLLPDDDKLQKDLEALQILESQATQAAQNIASAFGKAGTAIGAALTSFSNYRTTEAALAVQYHKGEITRAQQAAQLTNAKIRGYGDMTTAAKGYFSASSAGYKVLQTAEIAFRTIETLNTIQAMALDSAHTASSVTNSATRASADGVAAYAKTLASLPFPFNLAAGATVIAALAAVGVAIAGGGGGGGPKPGSTDLEDRQAGQGAGSVLGDATAKSASIARSLEIANANQNRDLEYSSQMVRSLRSIESNIGSLTAAVARSLSVDSFLNGSSAQTGSSFNRNLLGDGLSNIPLVGGLLGGLFGTKTKTTLQDTGINFADQSIADILAGGVDAQAYQQTLTTRKKKFFGVTTGSKSTVNTDYSDLDAGLTGDFTRVIASLRDGVLTAAGIIGVEGAQATLDAFQLSLGTVSLKDLKGDDLEAALTAVFGKAADQMAAAVLPSVTKFQEVGEGAFETINRLARDYQVVDITLKSIGKTFALVGLDSLEARERLIDLAGGLDALQDATSFFAENFLSDAERLAPVQKAVTDELKRLGLEGLKTRDQFKATVLGLDVSTAAGADLYASLLALAPAFAKVTEEAEKLTQAAIDTADSRIDDARSVISKVKSDLNEAYSRQSSALKAQIDAFASIGRGLREQDGRLAGQAIVSPTLTTSSARAAFDEAAAAVRANPGDRDAYSKLQTAGDALVSASKVSSTSSLAFNRDIADVRRELQAAGVLAQGQADTAQEQLSALTDLVEGQLGANETLKTVAQLLVDLNAAQKELVAALADREKLNPTTSGNDNSIDVAKYLASNPDLKRNWDAGGSLRGAGATLEEAARAHYETTGKFEIQAGLRKFATGGSFTVGGAGGTDSKLVQFMATPGEMVDVRTPAQGGGGGANAELLAEMRAMRAELSALRSKQDSQLAEANRHARNTAETIIKVTEGGVVMKTRDVA